MKQLMRGALIGILVFGVAGCDKVSKYFDHKSPKETSSFGGVKVVEVQSKGLGATRNAAVLDALNMAVKQTNGSPISGTVLNSTGSLAIPGHEGKFDITNDTVVSITKGVVQSFEILSEKESAKEWRVTLKVMLNKYEGSAAGTRPKVAIAIPRTHEDYYVVGDQSLSAADASSSIRLIIGESIEKSNRFFVINHSFDEAINSELAQINNPSTNQADLAKLGQRLTADILILPEIMGLAYRKTTRTLRFSGRALNSYEGEVDISFNVINVVTGQLIMTKRYSAKFPATPPSVYGSQKVGIANVKDSLAEMSNNFTRSFILKNFPVSVIKLDGQAVILSQGEPMLHVGETYDAVMLGEEISDPQTGQSLGRIESPVGTIVVAKVNDKMAMGSLNVKGDISQFKSGNIELRDRVVTFLAKEQHEVPAISAPAITPAPVVAPETDTHSKLQRKIPDSKDPFDKGFDKF